MTADNPRSGDPESSHASESEQAWGSDVVADLLNAYGFEYVVFNPGASFRGIEESIVNYSDNNPTVIEAPNECLSVSIAHGYAKASGKPGLCILHDVVGTLNASMGIYNAFIDHIPILILSGTGPMRKSQRRPWIDWIHTANIQGNLVRDFVKWDDQPYHIDGIVDSLVRAHEIAETEPKGPTYVTLDHEMQETPLDEPVELPDLEKYPTPSRMAPDPTEIDRAATTLIDAELPVILVDQVGDSKEAVDALVRLAELLGAPVLDLIWRRFNFPNTHPLYLSGSRIYEEADVILGLDVWDLNWITRDAGTTLEDAVKNDFTYIEIGTHELGASGLFPNTYSIQATDISILADTGLAIPSLADMVASKLDQDTSARKRAESRFDRMTSLYDDLHDQWQTEAEAVWDDTPISTPRLAGEVWNTIQDDEWALVNNMYPPWTERLWDVEEFDQYIGGHAHGAGVGHGIGAAIGASLAYIDSDKIPVNIQPDGDLMQFLGALWVLGHYEIPLLTVMHNNRTMYNSTNHRIELAKHRGRDDSFDRALIGTGYWDPTPDYSSIAEGMGVTGYGPITDPDDLAPALQEAWNDVQDGKPVLVDVVCQPR